MNTEMLKQK